MTKDKSILINNIYHMLSYAFQALNQETYEDVAVESFDEMYNLLAAILSKGIGLQLKQGLYREYISRQEELSVMRGKINMPGTIKNRLAHKRVLTCDFDELSENNLLNQILKTTVTLLLRNGKVQAKYKDDLKKKMLYFSNVEIIEPTGIKWSSIRFQRNNQTYRMLVSICQLIIEGMLITTDSGDYRLASFVDEQRMCRLYEKFILEYYSRHYPELSVSASQIPWSLDDGIGTMLPVMQSDIHLQRGNSLPQKMSEDEVHLKEIMQIPGVKALFEKHGYATSFVPSEFILTPPMFNNIYKGALGEVVGKYILEQYAGVTLQEMPPEFFELFDYTLGNGVYIDFKLWKETMLISAEEEKKNVLEKLDKCGGKRAVIINIMLDHNMQITSSDTLGIIAGFLYTVNS